MRGRDSDLAIGDIVLVLRGRDKGLLMLVVGRIGERILIADGLRRRFAAAKRKNPRHVRCVAAAGSWLGRLKEGHFTDADIRQLLETAEREQKGGLWDAEK